jgi:hypothetical protein
LPLKAAPTPEMITAGVDVLKNELYRRNRHGDVRLSDLAKRVFLAMEAARERSPAQ